MIRYALACSAGHEFESWFRSSSDYEGQEKRGLVGCPVCGSTRVQRQMMSPKIARTDRGTDDTPAQPMALIDPQAQALREKITALRAALTADSEDVGTRFAEEARKIHYGETDARTIHGQASRDEAKSLIEEGVEFMPLPQVPDDRN